MSGYMICENCTYFDEEEKECRQKPPVIVPGENNVTQMHQSLFPKVNTDDWCAEMSLSAKYQMGTIDLEDKQCP